MPKPRNVAERPNGSVAAAVLAGGVGSLAMGLMTVLAEASEPLRAGLSFYVPAGPLSGKTTVAVVIWLAAWAVLGNLWKTKEVDFDRAFRWGLALLALGLLGTFPPFFGLFGAE